MQPPPEIKPDFFCPVCDTYPMRPSHYKGEYFVYVCSDPDCKGKREMKMTKYNEYREILRPREIREG